MSKTQIDKTKATDLEKDRQILRTGIMAELDAVSLYEQLAATATDPLIKKVLLDVAREEKTHIGEFQSLLLEMDEEQKEELEIGMREIEELREEE
ncbi:MAG: ferritin family protein [Candidatus Omnitrophica bacterium]|nr:ferritin family protein [Candidatus Omnitrophota bacterium]MDD4013200.1 ferritin family protein [Candidatus Omnitrophota bacterium]